MKWAKSGAVTLKTLACGDLHRSGLSLRVTAALIHRTEPNKHQRASERGRNKKCVSGTPTHTRELEKCS